MRPYIEAIGKNSTSYVICYPNAGKLSCFGPPIFDIHLTGRMELMFIEIPTK